MGFIRAAYLLILAFGPSFLSAKFNNLSQLRSAAYRKRNRRITIDTLGLPVNYARALYISALVSKALLGFAAWEVLQHGGFSQNKEAYCMYILLLALAPFCRLYSSTSARQKRNLCPDVTVLTLLHLLTMHFFSRVTPLAGYLVLPSLGWVCFTVTLTACFIRQRRTRDVSWGSESLHHSSDVPKSVGFKSPTERRRSGQFHQPILNVTPVEANFDDSEVSPFANKPGFQNPLTEAKELLMTLTESLGRKQTMDGPAVAHLKAGLLRVHTLLGEVNMETRTPGPLSRVSSIFKEAFSFTKALSDEVDYGAEWPCSDSIPVSYFSHPGTAGFKVRGPEYLIDKKKIVAESCQTRLVSLNLLSVKEPTYHIARFLPSIKDNGAPFTFVWQIMVPGRSTNISLTVAWALDHDPLDAIKEAMSEYQQTDSAKQSTPTGAKSPLRPHRATDPQVRTYASASKAEPSVRDLDRGHMSPSLLRQSNTVDANSVETSHRSAANLSKLEKESPLPKTHRRVQSTAPTIDLSSIHEPLSTRSSVADAGAAESKVPALAGVQPFDIAMARFLDETGSEAAVLARRHSMFKIIPRIEKGSWLIRQAVGQTPVLLGKKLTTKYFRGPRYIEVDIDIGSSSAAAHVTGLVQGSLKSLVIDMAVLLEGRSTEELPESLLGTVRLQNLDLSKAAELDPITGTLTPKE